MADRVELLRDETARQRRGASPADRAPFGSTLAFRRAANSSKASTWSCSRLSEVLISQRSGRELTRERALMHERRKKVIYFGSTKKPEMPHECRAVNLFDT